MSKVRVAAFSISLDGFGAGPEQSLENPMGLGAGALHGWFRGTRTFQQMIGKPDGGTTGVDEDFAAKSFENLGAWILGRNMFGPVRGRWLDDSWKGWWGDTPPYRVPVYVLTHHARPSLEMNGGTVFHFVTEGPEAALARAKADAGGKDIRIGGGVSTVRQYLQSAAIDELHLAVSPVFLGRGENLFHDLDLPALGYSSATVTPGEKATHLLVPRAR